MTSNGVDQGKNRASIEGSVDPRSKEYPAYVRIKDFRYPDRTKLAVNFTVNFDAQLLRKIKNEPIMEVTRGEFGGRVGIWRLMELFHGHGIRLTIFTPGRIGELYPRALKEAARQGHQLENLTWDKTIPSELDIEKEHIRKTTDILEKISGRKPVGTRSGHRLSILKSEGYLYTTSTAVPDDLPCYVSDDGGETYMLCLPASIELDDAMYYSFGWFGAANAGNRLAEPSKVYEIWLSAFRQFYKLGGYMNFMLHDFDSGRASRIAMLDSLIREMKRWPNVWFPTCEELAAYCINHFPPPREKGKGVS